MNRSVFWALVRKDLYMMRAFIVGAISLGLLSVMLALTGNKTAFAVGGVLFLTANVASGIFIAMYSMFTERKEHNRLFALSLPVSGADFERSKIVGVTLSFAIPWLLMTVLAVSLFAFVPGATRGMVIYVLVLQGFVMALFSVVLTALFIIRSEVASGIVIMTVNILFSLFMVQINQPEIARPMRSMEIVWTPFSIGMFTAEATVVALSFCIALFITARRRDYI